MNKGKLSFLPHIGDRFLLASAVASKCNVFLTMDYRTILIHRQRIEKVVDPMEVLRPCEFLGYVPSVH